MVKIDALYFLLLIEILVILLGSTVYLALKNRKYRGVVQQASQENLEAKDTPPKKPTEEISSPGKDTNEILHRVVDLQKSMFLDLGQHKELFEKAFKRLALAQVENQGVHTRTKSLMETPGKREEVGEAIRRSEKSGQELETSVGTLNDEKDEFLKILRVWEDELKKLIEGMDFQEAGDQLRYKEILKEKEDLNGRINKLEEQLKEKDDLLEKTKMGYSNLEKEYTILYQQKEEEERKKR
jgi:chromosome segregation ATPase